MIKNWKFQLQAAVTVMVNALRVCLIAAIPYWKSPLHVHIIAISYYLVQKNASVISKMVDH